MYVGDTNYNRVSVFDSQGNFLRAFGYDVIPGGLAGLEVCSYATTCKTGVSGGAAGQLDVPYVLAVGPGGNLYVADGVNDRISVFTPEGAFVRAFGQDVGGAGQNVCTSVCQTGTSGGAAGQLAAPEDVAFGSTGNLFVADTSNNRISVFTPEGSFVRAFGLNVGGVGQNVCTAVCQAGTAGGAAGQLNDPEGVGTDPAGNVLVGDSSNNRVSVFTPEGVFLRAFGRDVDPAGGSGGFEICTAVCKVGVVGTGAGEFNGPIGVASDCRGSVYVSDSNNDRIQKLGEPGVRSAPCPLNAFSFGKLKRNKRTGTAKLTVILPGPGILRLVGKGLKKQRPAGALASRTVSVAGKVKLLIKSKGRKLRKLKRSGKVKVRARVTYTPTNGDPNTKAKKLRLRKRLLHP